MFASKPGLLYWPSSLDITNIELAGIKHKTYNKYILSTDFKTYRCNHGIHISELLSEHIGTQEKPVGHY